MMLLRAHASDYLRLLDGATGRQPALTVPDLPEQESTVRWLKDAAPLGEALFYGAKPCPLSTSRIGQDASSQLSPLLEAASSRMLQENIAKICHNTADDFMGGLYNGATEALSAFADLEHEAWTSEHQRRQVRQKSRMESWAKDASRPTPVAMAAAAAAAAKDRVAIAASAPRNVSDNKVPEAADHEVDRASAGHEVHHVEGVIDDPSRNRDIENGINKAGGHEESFPDLPSAMGGHEGTDEGRVAGTSAVEEHHGGSGDVKIQANSAEQKEQEHVGNILEIEAFCKSPDILLLGAHAISEQLSFPLQLPDAESLLGIPLEEFISKHCCTCEEGTGGEEPPASCEHCTSLLLQLHFAEIVDRLDKHYSASTDEDGKPGKETDFWQLLDEESPVPASVWQMEGEVALPEAVAPAPPPTTTLEEHFIADCWRRGTEQVPIQILKVPTPTGTLPLPEDAACLFQSSSATASENEPKQGVPPGLSFVGALHAARWPLRGEQELANAAPAGHLLELLGRLAPATGLLRSDEPSVVSSSLAELLGGGGDARNAETSIPFQLPTPALEEASSNSHVEETWSTDAHPDGSRDAKPRWASLQAFRALAPLPQSLLRFRRCLGSARTAPHKAPDRGSTWHRDSAREAEGAVEKKGSMGASSVSPVEHPCPALSGELDLVEHLHFSAQSMWTALKENFPDLFDPEEIQKYFGVSELEEVPGNDALQRGLRSWIERLRHDNKEAGSFYLEACEKVSSIIALRALRDELVESGLLQAAVYADALLVRYPESVLKCCRWTEQALDWIHDLVVSVKRPVPQPNSATRVDFVTLPKQRAAPRSPPLSNLCKFAGCVGCCTRLQDFSEVAAVERVKATELFRLAERASSRRRRLVVVFSSQCLLAVVYQCLVGSGSPDIPIASTIDALTPVTTVVKHLMGLAGILLVHETAIASPQPSQSSQSPDTVIAAWEVNRVLRQRCLVAAYQPLTSPSATSLITIQLRGCAYVCKDDSWRAISNGGNDQAQEDGAPKANERRGDICLPRRPALRSAKTLGQSCGSTGNSFEQSSVTQGGSGPSEEHQHETIPLSKNGQGHLDDHTNSALSREAHGELHMQRSSEQHSRAVSGVLPLQRNFIDRDWAQDDDAHQGCRRGADSDFSSFRPDEYTIARFNKEPPSAGSDQGCQNIALENFSSKADRLHHPASRGRGSIEELSYDQVRSQRRREQYDVDQEPGGQSISDPSRDERRQYNEQYHMREEASDLREFQYEADTVHGETPRKRAPTRNVPYPDVDRDRQEWVREEADVRAQCHGFKSRVAKEDFESTFEAQNREPAQYTPPFEEIDNPGRRPAHQGRARGSEQQDRAPDERRRLDTATSRTSEAQHHSRLQQVRADRDGEHAYREDLHRCRRQEHGASVQDERQRAEADVFRTATYVPEVPPRQNRSREDFARRDIEFDDRWPKERSGTPGVKTSKHDAERDCRDDAQRYREGSGRSIEEVARRDVESNHRDEMQGYREQSSRSSAEESYIFRNSQRNTGFNVVPACEDATSNRPKRVPGGERHRSEAELRNQEGDVNHPMWVYKNGAYADEFVCSTPRQAALREDGDLLTPEAPTPAFRTARCQSHRATYGTARSGWGHDGPNRFGRTSPRGAKRPRSNGDTLFTELRHGGGAVRQTASAAPARRGGGSGSMALVPRGTQAIQREWRGQEAPSRNAQQRPRQSQQPPSAMLRGEPRPVRSSRGEILGDIGGSRRRGGGGGGGPARRELDPWADG